MTKNELIFKDEFVARTGVSFDSLRLWAAKNKLPPLLAKTVMAKNGIGRRQGLYSLSQALDYKARKGAEYPTSKGGENDKNP